MLYLVRHGRTVWNRAGRFQGQQDSPLLQEGREQALAAGAALKGAGITRLFASPLGRAATSAALVGEALGLTPVHDDRLMECAYGIAEGLTADETEARHSGLWSWRDVDKWSRAFPGGESYADLAGRLADFIAEHLTGADRAAEATCVVSHRGVSRGIAGVLLAWTPEQVLGSDQGNDEIYRIVEGRLETIRPSTA